MKPWLKEQLHWSNPLLAILGLLVVAALCTAFGSVRVSLRFTDTPCIEHQLLEAELVPHCAAGEAYACKQLGRLRVVEASCLEGEGL